MRSTEQEFNLWYYGKGEDKGYPRKEARGDARKAFVQARRIASLEELIEGRKQYSKQGRETQFTQLPATWLRAEGWANEYEAPKEDYGFRMEGGEKHNLMACLANGIWRDEWGAEPDRADAKARLDEINAPRYGLKVVR